MSETDFETSSSALIKTIIEDLFSYNTTKRNQILEYYFFPTAALSSPLMSTKGIECIRHSYTVWQTLNRTEPTINNIVFDGHTAVVHLTHNLSPTVLPSFLKLQVPAITTFYFSETELESGLLKIYKQEDSWTLEGLMQSVPLISFWYNNILRSVMGKVLTTTGDILDSAMEHAQQLKLQSRDIQQLGHQVAVDNISKLDEYKSDLKEIYLKGVKESE